VGKIDSAGGLSAPEKLNLSHDLSQFPALDEWLRRRALRNEESGASRTYVICAGRQVEGAQRIERFSRAPCIRLTWPSWSAKCARMRS